MNFEIYGTNKNISFLINTDKNIYLINDVNSALDLMATVAYETNCNSIIIKKEDICPDFFDLKTGIAGEILQKFANYSFKIAIIGDFSSIISKSLKDFIFECNSGNYIFFQDSLENALNKLN